MILHYIEAADGTRHVHIAHCEGIAAQLKAGEVWEIEVPDGDEDAMLVAVWEDFEPGLDELDGYFEMTVFRDCAEVFYGEETSGNPKADAFMDEAEAAGWEVEYVTDEDHVAVKARREYIAQALRTHEVLELSWSPSRLIEAHYLSGIAGDVAKKLSSVKGAIERLKADVPKPRVNGHRVQRDEPVKRILKTKLPFDIEEAYDDEIIAAVRGKKIVWLNNTSENYEEALVTNKTDRHIRIETGTAGRAILTFISPEGFRSVALESLVQVK